jgi:hypothetical protein
MRSPRRLLVLAVASPLFLSGCFLHVRLPDMPAGRQSDYGLRMEAGAAVAPHAVAAGGGVLVVLRRGWLAFTRLVDPHAEAVELADTVWCRAGDGAGW